MNTVDQKTPLAPEGTASPVDQKTVTDALQFSKEFHLKEWESLREEISSQIDHTRKLELATVAGLGAFYAWFASEKVKSPSEFLLVIPFLLVLLAGLRAWGTLVRIRQIAIYIRTIEEEFCLGTNDLIGWDRTLKEKFSKSSPFKISAAVFWFATLAVSVLASLFLRK